MSAELSFSKSRAGLDARRVAEVIVTRSDGSSWRGSGYRINTKSVLTAEHVVSDALSIAVRFNADRPEQQVFSATIAWSSCDIDIAVLSITGAKAGAEATNVVFGQLPKRDTAFTYSMVGFPRFKLRTDRSKSESHFGPSQYRDSHHEVGIVNPFSNMREGTYALDVHTPAAIPGSERSPWDGMSGAAVWSGGLLIGVVSKHHRSDGLGQLAALRVERWFEKISPDDIKTLHVLIGLPEDVHDLETGAEPQFTVIPALLASHTQRPYIRSLLPPAPQGFIGRDDEIALLLKKLEPVQPGPAAVLVSAVAGMGGIGKSALALHTAHRAVMRAWFPGGAYFIDLHGYDLDATTHLSFAQAVRSLLRVFGVGDSDLPVHSDEQINLYHEILAALSQNGLRVLLVLDNVSSESQVRQLLPRGGNHRALITSRHTLGMLKGVSLIDLDVLDPSSGYTLIKEALREARPDDDRAANEPEELARLVDLCAGLPLALQIIAARLRSSRHRKISSFVAEMDEARTRLSAFAYDGDPPIAVKAAFDLSYQHLDPVRARLFRFLSVLPGPDVDLDAAAVLADTPKVETQRHLDGLERAHLIESDASGERWTIHDLVRLYAAVLAELEEDQSALGGARIRILKYYADTTEQMAESLATDGDAARSQSSLNWLTHHRAHIAAAATAAVNNKVPELALRLARPAGTFLRDRQFHDDAIALATAARDAAHLMGARDAEAEAWASLGEALNSANRPQDALDAHKHHLAIRRDLGDHPGQVVAYTELSKTYEVLGVRELALDLARRAIRIADTRKLDVLAAKARSAVVILLAEAGQAQTALAQAAVAEAALSAVPDAEVDLARLRVNIGLVLQRTGRIAEALAYYGAAERVLREHGDARWEAIMLNSRGVLLAYRGNHAETTRDLNRAARLASDHGLDTLHQRALHNLGFAALRAGDLPKALRALDEARTVGEQLGLHIESVLSDRAEALLAAGLVEDARQYAEQAADGHMRNGLVLNASEARLSAANAALAAGDATAAAEYAHAARLAFIRQRQPGWGAWARSVENAARFAAGERSGRMLRDLVRNSAQLEQVGRLVTSQESKLLAARTASALGRADEAAQLFTQVASVRNSGPARRRVIGWEAEAALRESRGDVVGAARAVDRGLRVAANYIATLGAADHTLPLGAADLCAGAAPLDANLAETGLRLALSGGSARQILARAEQWRAVTTRLRPVRPPDGAAFAERLGRLRAVTMQINVEGLPGKNVRKLQAVRVRLEREVMELARHAPGSRYAPQSRLDLTALSEQLGERVLVEYVRAGDSLHAVSVVDGRTRHHHLGSYKAVLSEFEGLRFSLGRMARRYGSPALQQAAHAAYEYARNELDGALVRPMAKQIGDRPLVLVPSGSLFALAWPVLPSLTARQVTVSPSARSWLTAASGPVDAARHPSGEHRSIGERVVLAHGPGLPHAEAEIGELARRYPLARPLIGTDATARTVAEALDGAQLAHIAAHGRFRSDNPLFSIFELADGPLTVYDLEGIRHAPATLVLSACDTALSGIRPGDELNGLTSAMLALGTRTLIASVAPVDDAETRALMNALHAALSAGHSPTKALVSAQRAVPEARGFVCFGRGD